MAVYGIDLGTTYSCLAKFENDAPAIIQTDMGTNSLASAVYFGENGDTLIGDEAKGYVQTEGHRVVQFVKREIGKAALPHEIDGKSYNAIEISALILKKIKKYAADQGEIVKDVVITCPAYFGNEERDATKKAGILAGFNVLELINEPTAAAISYAYTNSNMKDETVVVYDLGGGTFDVTVLDIKMKSNGIPICTVLATDGDDQLGGKDWDEVLGNIIREKMMSDNGVNELTDDDEAAIISVIEPTKKSLTARETVTVRCRIGGESLTCDITREEFELATAGLLQQTVDCLDRILNSPKMASVKIDQILLVGGSSNMPMVANLIKERYGKNGAVPVIKKDAETAVAQGAAIYAHMITKVKKASGGFLLDADDDGGTIEIHDITSRTFGVGTWDSKTDGLKLDNLIYKGEDMPASVMKIYTPVHDNQMGVGFHIYENVITERGLYVPLDVDDNGELQSSDPVHGLKHLGYILLRLPPNSPKTTQLETTMAVTGAGIHVKVHNTVTGDTEEIDIDFKNNDVEMDNNHINALSIE